MKYEVHVLVLAFLLPDTLYAGRCRDGNAKYQKIVEKPPQDFQIEEGTDATLQWAYCKTEKNTITGIIMLRYPRKNPHLLAMDVAGKVYYYQTSPKHHRITWNKENGTITFIIKNPSINDTGIYSLEIRRVGYADLENRVKAVVRWAASQHHSTTTITTTTSTGNLILFTKTRIFISSTDLKSTLESLFKHSPSHTAHQTPKSARVTVSMHPGLTVLETKISKNEEEHELVVIILLCVVAGMVPIALFLVLLAVYKQQRRRNKRTKKGNNSQNRTDQGINTQQQERLFTNQQRRGETSVAELDDSFSALSMSGFSYRDSPEHSEASVEEPVSTITFGIGQSRTPVARNDLSLIATPKIKQDASCPLLPKRKSYELERKLIHSMKIVGQGAFGLVAKASLLHENELCTVAVKMLKDIASSDDRKDLISECNLMKRLDSHKNVVELLGFVLQSEPIWVVTEYALHGDLLGFLRKSRGIQDTVYHGVTTYSGSNLTQVQLLKMAKDIACGMAHLAQNKIIHRDLAARNVLVDEDITCKITDFGMARDVKSTNYYRTRNRGRIPFKWTALEGLLYDKYTTMSDVWSFGVVLYEIVTIGGSPYPRLGPREILRRLKRGWRMNKPGHVNTELYNVMLKCWQPSPEERPSFLDLSRLFGTILGTQCEYINVKEYKDLLCYPVLRGSEASTESDDHEVFV